MNLINDTTGTTAVEYAVLLSLIIVACAVTVMALGASANDLFTTIGNSIYSG